MRAKYGNIKTEVDGYKFDSRKEGQRYGVLKLMQRAGEISNLVLQPKFPIVVEGKKICTYIADFQYEQWTVVTKPGAVIEAKRLDTIVEDVKGIKTPVYNLKKKLMKACLNIDITEV